MTAESDDQLGPDGAAAPLDGVPSPCIGDCTLRPWRGTASPTCKGCDRTLDEIVGWRNYTDDQRRAVWRRLRA